MKIKSALEAMRQAQFTRTTKRLIALDFDRARADRIAIAEMTLAKKSDVDIADVLQTAHIRLARGDDPSLPEAMSKFPNCPTAVQLAAHPGTFVRLVARAAAEAGPDALAEQVFAQARFAHAGRMNDIRAHLNLREILEKEDAALPKPATQRTRMKGPKL